MTIEQALEKIKDIAIYNGLDDEILMDEYLYEHRLLSKVFGTTPFQNIFLTYLCDHSNGAEYFSLDVFMAYLYNELIESPEEVRELIRDFARKDMIEISYSSDINYDPNLLIRFKNDTVKKMNQEHPAPSGRYTTATFNEYGFYEY